VIAGSVAAWLIVTRLMTLSFVWQAGSAAAVVAAAPVVTVGVGLAGTLLALNQKPAKVLRDLWKNEPGRRRAPDPTGNLRVNGISSLFHALEATFSRAWKLALNVLVSHIPAKPETPFDDSILMSAGGRFLG